MTPFRISDRFIFILFFLHKFAEKTYTFFYQSIKLKFVFKLVEFRAQIVENDLHPQTVLRD